MWKKLMTISFGENDKYFDQDKYLYEFWQLIWKKEAVFLQDMKSLSLIETFDSYVIIYIGRLTQLIKMLACICNTLSWILL